MESILKCCLCKPKNNFPPALKKVASFKGFFSVTYEKHFGGDAKQWHCVSPK